MPENGKDSLAKRAIDVLATDTLQQSYLRERILTNTKLTESRRVAAFVGLAKYDGSFASYASQLAVIDLALQVGQVPGRETLTGLDLIAQRVQQETKGNQALRDQYTHRFEEAVKRIDDPTGNNP